MERHFESQLRELKDYILAMGGYVEKAIEIATLALINRDADGFEEVYEFETKINESHKHIDDLCLRMLAKQGPVARDLRLILAIIKINTDLERMGDQACSISYHAKDYLKQIPIEMAEEFKPMSSSVRKMVRSALDAIVNEDAQLAKQVLEQDDVIDEQKRKVSQSVVNLIKQDKAVVDGAIDLLIVARALERIGDHATNIAEDVIFAATGRDVRHGDGA